MNTAIQLTPELAQEYNTLWLSLRVTPNKLPEIQGIIKKILTNRPRYEAVAQKTGVPWFFIAILHSLESDLDFHTHLHNGDPLNARTINVPAGRPKLGNPPFTWEISAVDALALHGLSLITDWTVSRLAFEFERWNGFGYRQYHPTVKSPYLWSCSNQYTCGKYASDGHFAPDLVSAQAGTMPLLRTLIGQGAVTI